jgi:hypothetical protein
MAKFAFSDVERASLYLAHHDIAVSIALLSKIELVNISVLIKPG